MFLDFFFKFKKKNKKKKNKKKQNKTKQPKTETRHIHKQLKELH